MYENGVFKYMTRILFMCHGNICRSTMAEFVMKDLVKKAGLSDKFFIDSAGTSSEEEGHGVHPGTVVKLRAVGVPVGSHVARKITQEDFQNFDYIIGMDDANMRNLERMSNPSIWGKFSKLLTYVGISDDIADPWYTGNFDETYEDVSSGCRALLQQLKYRKDS